MPLFFIVFSGILVASWIYLWRRLVVASHLTPWLRQGLLVIFVFLLLLQLALPFLYRYTATDRIKVPSSIFWIGYSALGFMTLLVFAVIARDILVFLSQKTFAQNFDDSRRIFLFRSINALTVGLASGAAILGTQTALLGPSLREVHVPVDDLHPDLQGFTVAQISDFHIGPTIRRRHVERVVQMIREARPDMIAVTGDLVDGTPEQLAEDLAPLMELKAPHGVYFVSGNHEYYWNVDAWTNKVKTLGMDPLNNEHRLLMIKKARLIIGGVRDISCGRLRPDHVSDPHEALKGAPTADFKILLAHQPRSCYKGADAGFQLMLSGHTHHGQFMPWNFVTKFFHPYYKGLNRHDDKMWVYVNAATGYWGPPQRLGIPSEVSLIRLQGSKA